MAGAVENPTPFPEELKGKQVVVLGAGRSGRAAAALLARQDARVVLADDDPNAIHPDELEEVVASHLELVLGEVGLGPAAAADGIVVSPGVPLSHPLIVEAGRRGVPVIGELELGSRFVGAPIVAVTGTNGKTTTVNWIAHLLAKSGMKAVVGGNVGTAICSVAMQPADWFVLEVSSYQLETIDRFRARVAAILNLSPDHADRHPTRDAYLACKARIGANQGADDAIILNGDDEPIRSVGASAGGRVWEFSLDRAVERGAYVEDGWIAIRANGNRSPERLLAIGELALPGRHNLANALAAAAAAWLCGAGGAGIRQGLRDFAGVEHRLERTRELRGVLYVNDSKATNVASLEVALNSYERPIVLIAGGRGKGAPYDGLTRLVASKVRRLFVLGEEAQRMSEAWERHVPTERVADMEEATRRAAEAAEAGDVVLLSPACASFDMYRNYEERGRHFKDAVMRLE